MMKKWTLLIFICFLIIGCAKRTDGNLIGCWKSISSNEKPMGVSMSSTIVLIFNDDNSYQKTVDMWIGDENKPIIIKDDFRRDGNNITLIQTNTETGKPVIGNHVITELSDEVLVMDNNFKYERVY